MLRQWALWMLAIGFMTTESAHAFYAGAYANAGVGIWGGSPGCYGAYSGSSGRVKKPRAVEDIEDDIDDLRRNQKEIRKEIDKQKKKLSELEKTRKEQVKAIESVLIPDFAKAVIENAEPANRFTAEDMNLGTKCGEGTTVIPAEARARVPKSLDKYYQTCQPDPLTRSLIDGWSGFVRNGPRPGAVHGDICQGNDNFVNPAYKGPLANQGFASKMISLCKQGVMELVDVNDQIASLKIALAALEAQNNDIDELLKEAQDRRRDAIRQAREDAEEGIYDYDTEADDDCVDCGRYRNAPKVSTFDKVVGILGMFGAYKLGQYGVKEYNKTLRRDQELGWPAWTASPWISVGAGLSGAALMAGIYGATFGGGVGGWGCNDPYGPYGAYGPGAMMGLYPPMGGVFGYPAGWGGGFGGGLYMPGMGPWGVPGPWGGGIGIGGGMPMMGFIASGIGGIMMGMPMAGGMPMMGGMMPMMGGMMPFYGMIGPMAGMIAAGIGGANVGMPMGGMMPGMMAAGIGGVMMGMYTPYVGTMGPMMGTTMMMGPFSGVTFAPMMAGMMMSGQIAMQYQQMMLQQQQMQLQFWMQQQQAAMAAQQDMMVRQQMISRLYGQLTQIQMQIQQISMGYYSGAGVSIGDIVPMPGTGTGIGSFTGSSYSPYSPAYFNGTTTTGNGIQGRGRWSGQ